MTSSHPLQLFLGSFQNSQQWQQLISTTTEDGAGKKSAKSNCKRPFKNSRFIRLSQFFFVTRLTLVWGVLVATTTTFFNLNKSNKIRSYL